MGNENSKGVHPSQESARILAESIDFRRQAQVMALRLASEKAASAASEEAATPQPTD